MSLWSSFLAWFGIVDFVAGPFTLAFTTDLENLMLVTGTITPAAVPHNVPFARLVATVTIQGSTAAPITLDVLHAPATFPAKVGDKGDVTLIAYSEAGIPSAPTIVPFDLTAPDAVPVTLAFTQAPSPTAP